MTVNVALGVLTAVVALISISSVLTIGRALIKRFQDEEKKKKKQQAQTQPQIN